MINEIDIVTITHGVAEYNLKRGDIGTVVHYYGDGKAYEVEFINNDGRTIALLTLTDTDIQIEVLTPYSVSS